MFIILNEFYNIFVDLLLFEKNLMIMIIYRYIDKFIVLVFFK